MKSKAINWKSLTIIFLLAAAINLIVTSCRQTNKMSEIEGFVVAKRDPTDVLVVSNIDSNAIQNMNQAELLAFAERENGIYFSIDKTNFENVSVGTKVIIQYDPDDGEEISTPPRRHSKSIEIVSE
jgi:hypothetical protein